MAVVRVGVMYKDNKKKKKRKERKYKEIFCNGNLYKTKGWDYVVDLRDYRMKEVYYIEFILYEKGIFFWKEMTKNTEVVKSWEVAEMMQGGNIPKRILDLRFFYNRLEKT